MKRILLGSLILCVVTTRRVQAQIPVTDVGNLLQNTVQAVQTVLMVGNQLLELAGLGEIVLGDDMAAELDQLGGILEEAQGLRMDLATIQLHVTLLFDLHSAPQSSSALRQRLADIRQLTWTVYVDALRTQTLLQSSLSALRHMTRLLAAIGEFVGNNQGNQTLAQLDSKLTIELIKLKEQTAAHQRAQTVDRLTEPLTIESLYRIQESIMADWPR